MKICLRRSFSMSRRFGLLKQFGRNEHGNVAMMFGLSLIPMIAAGGTAIDYGRVSTAQSKIHSALDAAVLAVAKDPTISVDPATTAGQLTQSKIQTFFAANLSDSNLISTPNVVLKPTTSDKVLVEVTGCVKMAFAGFTGVIDPCVKASSEVTRGGSVKLEIALVMDNSGSMAGTKMTASQDAAKDFVKTLLAAAVTTDQVKIALVPFTSSVNTGLTRTSSGVDNTGVSPIHWENLLNVGDVKPASVTSRFSLYDQLGETWGGCMETRPGSYGLNDDAPSISTPASLYVPYFAPDDPGDRSGSKVNKSTINEYNNTTSYYTTPNSYLNDDGGSANTQSSSTGYENATSNPACTGGVAAFNRKYTSSTSAWQDKNYLWRLSSNICRYNLTGTSGGTTARKSVGANSSISSGSSIFPIGPNFLCHKTPVQRITNSKATLDASITSMVALGSTNILDGFMWGWRTVSPNAPYGDARAYNWTDTQYKNKKVIVLMTDGDNQWYSYADGSGASNPSISVYTPNGFYGNNRLGAGITTMAQGKAAMDTKTLEACNNAKAKKNAYNGDAITVYTIGFSTVGAEITASGKTLLESCASTGPDGKKLYYPATTAAELSKVFATIAADLSRLKLSK
jgi:Flp pilus assembly protein TadG